MRKEVQMDILAPSIFKLQDPPLYFTSILYYARRT